MQTVDVLIRNAKIVLEHRVIDGSIAISGGRIAAIGTADLRVDAAEVIDARGGIVMPGAVDPHAHIWEPTNYPEREDWMTGTQAAAAGGVTTLVEMPLSVPPVTDAKTFEGKHDAIKAKPVVDYAFWGALTEKSTGHYAEMNDVGATAFKVFIPYASPDYPHTPDYALLKSMEEIAAFDGLVGVHAENADIIDNLQKVMKAAGRNDGLAHEEGRPVIAELEAIQRVLLFAEHTGVRLHVCHLSTAAARDMLNQAKARGVRVTVETCPHYLVMSTKDLERCGGFAKCNPPLRDPANLDLLWDMVLTGEIDMIGSDHTPYTDEDRLSQGNDIWAMPPGIGGMDLMVPLMIDEGIHRRGLSWPHLSRLLATEPARRFGLYPRKGSIEPGADADLVLIDPDAEWNWSHADSFQKSKCRNSPYEGRKIKGRVTRTLVRGTTVFNDGKIIAEPGFGELIRKPV